MVSVAINHDYEEMKLVPSRHTETAGKTWRGTYISAVYILQLLVPILLCEFDCVPLNTSAGLWEQYDLSQPYFT